MITIQERIYSRLTGDTAATVSLQALLGSSGRIYAGLDANIIQAPSIVFNNLTNIPGEVNSDTVQTDVEFYTFKVFANNCIQIISRLRALLAGYTFTETAEAGGLRCVWDSDGPDLFDEDLKVRRKDVRFRVYSAPKAIGQI